MISIILLLSLAAAFGWLYTRLPFTAFVVLFAGLCSGLTEYPVFLWVVLIWGAWVTIPVKLDDAG